MNLKIGKLVGSMKKYKYLVVNGCSQTSGQNCVVEETWPVKLSKKLGLELINLATPSTGWYHIQNSTTSFIQNNKKILDECFFIFQTSMLDRRLNYEEIPLVRTDVWEKWNIKYMSKSANSAKGFINWKKYSYIELKPDWWDEAYPQFSTVYTDTHRVDCRLQFFPEHRHYSNKNNNWKIGDTNDEIPPYIQEQFQELMIYWGREISSFHLFIKNLGLDHVIVDGYSPFVSHQLKFDNYYENEQEFDFIKRFWNKKPMPEDQEEIMLYDFKNIKGKWLFDLIDEKNKITNTILWNAFLNQPPNPEWSPDGGHAGPKGMNRILEMICDNLITKGWFHEIHN
jgi:hypothetical protein